VLSHDGGIEENLAALPGLISRADAAFFPVDCISHSAVGKSRSAAGMETSRSFPFVRQASQVSFLPLAIKISSKSVSRPVLEKTAGD